MTIRLEIRVTVEADGFKLPFVFSLDASDTATMRDAIVVALEEAARATADGRVFAVDVPAAAFAALAHDGGSDVR